MACAANNEFAARQFDEAHWSACVEFLRADPDFGPQTEFIPIREPRRCINVNRRNGAAARQADICVLTVVQSAHQAALESLKKDLQGKILVDATARVDFRDARPPQAPSAARLAQQIVGDGVRVVAALQNVPSHALRRNLGGQLNTDVLVCADDVQAAIKLISLIESIGMRGFYAGGLDNAVVVEGITALLMSINKYYRTKTASIGVTGLEQVE